MNQVSPVQTPSPALVTLGNSPIRISSHAIARYSERVNRSASRTAAFQAIAEMLAAGTVRTTPRWWTACRLEPGTRLVYSAVNPDICLIVKNDTVVTLVTRDLCGSSRSIGRPGRSGIKATPYARMARDYDDEASDIYEPLPEELAWVA